MSQQKNNAGIYRKGFILLVIGLILTIAHLLGYDIVTPLKMAGLFSLVIVILVFVHELGHYIPAVLFGMRIDTFSIGFPPKLFSFKKGHTTYQIGLIPLGGFVRIHGTLGEGQSLESKPKLYEFRAKPIWQRIIVMSGGVIMNILLGIGLFSWIVYSEGQIKTPIATMESGIAVYSHLYGKNRCGEQTKQTTLGKIIGLKTGDKLLSMNGQAFEYLEDYFSLEDLFETNASVEVERNGRRLNLPIPVNITALGSSDTVALFFAAINIPSTVNIGSNSISEKAGLQNGDKITQIGQTPIEYFPDLYNHIPDYAKSDTAVLVKYERNGESFITQIQFDSTGLMGVGSRGSGLRDTLQLSMGESLISGAKSALTLAKVQTQGVGQIVTGQADASESLDGPVRIFQILWEIFKEKEGGNWLGVIALLGIFNIILAYMNLLPIPLLDGGQLVFLFWEGVSGQAPSPQIMNLASLMGFVLIMGLMLVIVSMDIIKIAAC